MNLSILQIICSYKLLSSPLSQIYAEIFVSLNAIVKNGKKRSERTTGGPIASPEDSLLQESPLKCVMAGAR
jgi:hypothetical protein